MTDKIQTFEAFWPYYVGEHRQPFVRGLHYFGTLLGTALAVAAILTRNPWFLVPGLICGYGPAWVGHYYFERNKPATLTYPLWSLRADYKMLMLALRGKMAIEVTRLYGSSAPAPDAPLRPQT